jgi:hypothetical protein
VLWRTTYRSRQEPYLLKPSYPPILWQEALGLDEKGASCRMAFFLNSIAATWNLTREMMSSQPG